MSMQDKETAILIENMNGKFDTLLELIGSMRESMATKQDLADVKAELQADIKVIKAARDR